jgi:hypothetical protein
MFYYMYIVGQEQVQEEEQVLVQEEEESNESPPGKIDVEALISENGDGSILDLTIKGLTADDIKILMELLRDNKVRKLTFLIKD